MLRTLFSFDGRLNRRNYWLKGLLPWLLTGNVAQVAIRATGLEDLAGGRFILPATVILIAGTFHALLAITAKRWHDMGHSGWWSLTSLIPVFSLLIVILIGFQRGDKDGNKYGPAPPRRQGKVNQPPESLQCRTTDPS